MENIIQLKDISTPIIKKRVVMFDNSGNKAVYHNKEVKQVTGNIYMGEIEGDYYSHLCPLYAIFGDRIGLYLGKLNADENIETIEKAIVKNKLTSFDSFIESINDRISNNNWINCVEKEYVSNYRPDLVANIEVARVAWNNKMEEKRKAREAEKEAERQAEIKEDNDKAEKIITAAKEVFKHGGVLENDTITLRNEKDYYDSTTRSIINYLLDEYGITVPIRTRGFINDRLASVTISADTKGVSYSYFRKGNSKGSQKIYDLMYALIDKIAEE